MTPLFFIGFFLLGLSSLATSLNFTQVLEWPDELDYEWPSEASRTQALEDVTFKPEKMYPRYLAVYGTRLFLNLLKENGIPVTLVSLLTTSTAPPKLSPFPSWDMHLNGTGNCNKIHQAEGLEMDSVGRLWVLDQGSSVSNCSSKLWIFNLNNNETELVHPISFHGLMNDLVIDETPDGTFAYISRWGEENVVVFSLERNQSWKVDTPGILVSSVALSPKVEPRKLYLGKESSNEVYSVSVTALRNGTRTAELEPIGNWATEDSYRMLMDNHGIMYAAFMDNNFISSWNTSQPLQEQRSYQVAGLKSASPFTFSLDQNGTLWMTVFDEERRPRFRLLKAAVGEKSAGGLFPLKL
ncbi:protein yellow-like [Cloeon dipterum]|uniref:protein yellow-like n=1 Tax=Cloeon dipterum TaxID=197152 RepID=UPI00322011C5